MNEELRDAIDEGLDYCQDMLDHYEMKYQRHTDWMKHNPKKVNDSTVSTQGYFEAQALLYFEAVNYITSHKSITTTTKQLLEESFEAYNWANEVLGMGVSSNKAEHLLLDLDESDEFKRHAQEVINYAKSQGI